MSNELYSRTNAGIDYYGSTTTGSEPNMRQELEDMFDGVSPEIAKAQPALLRRMRLDDDDQLIPCPCVDSVTKEPDKDRFCPICYGEGWLWDEEDLDIYRVIEDSDVDNTLRDTLVGPGLLNIPLVVFYTRYSSAITQNDKIVRLVLDVAGDPEEPYKRHSIYRVNTAWDYRSDNGKLEYWKVFTHRENVRFLNPPSYGDY